jgi:poly(3-hydroxybutyrate) depolymerase
MAPFLALLAFLQAAGMHVERVSVPGPSGVNLDAALVLPAGEPKAPPILAVLHGTATTGTNEPTRQDVLRRVPGWLETGHLARP